MSLQICDGSRLKLVESTLRRVGLTVGRVGSTVERLGGEWVTSGQPSIGGEKGKEGGLGASR